MPKSEDGADRRVAVPIPFNDDRPKRSICGDQKATYGLSRGVVECTGSPASDLAALLGNQLRASGYDVKAGDGSVGADTLRVEGDLLQFFVERVRAGGDVEADIHVRLRASSNSGLLAEREFYKKGRANNYQRAVNSAVRKTLIAMTDAITGLLDQHPTVARSTGRFTNDP